MPRYFFHFSDGERGYRDLQGTDHPDCLKALKDAQERAAELLYRLTRRDQREGWRFVVEEENRGTIAEIWLTAVFRTGEAIKQVEAEQRGTDYQAGMAA